MTVYLGIAFVYLILSNVAALGFAAVQPRYNRPYQNTK
jgi:hypothetical protein